MLKNIDKSWEPFFDDTIIKELDKIKKSIGNDYFPNEDNILRFASTNYDNIKCVIVGMEPYPTDYVKDGIKYPIATGRSFEVSSLSDKTWSYKIKQSSLRNILKTIYYNETGEIKPLEIVRQEINNGIFKILPPATWFDDLEKQGVLFLNASLTVKKYEVDTHTKIWADFMNSLIPFIDKNDVKWLLWGNKAQDRVLPYIDRKNAICSCHPRLADFVYENPFKYVKNINWTGTYTI